LVRPRLEYCIQIWNPHNIKDIKLIEGVQRRAIKLVQAMEGLHYDDRLKCLNLMRLETRRIRDSSDLIKTFKIIIDWKDRNLIANLYLKQTAVVRIGEELSEKAL